MNRDLFDTITALRGEPLGWVASQLHVSPATVEYVWDHHDELLAAFDPLALTDDPGSSD